MRAKEKPRCNGVSAERGTVTTTAPKFKDADMLLNYERIVNKKPFFITRQVFFRLILPWMGLITLTTYTNAKSRFLDRILDASEKGGRK